ncbi:MAG: SEC-C domain-containing protein [Polyangiaceae bacterium]|nr:SEC-C domain-containing protein [Polyangiaceae bacterium]
MLITDEVWETLDPDVFMPSIDAFRCLGMIGTVEAVKVLVDIGKKRDVNSLIEGALAMMSASRPETAVLYMEAAQDASLQAYKRSLFAAVAYELAAQHPALRAEVAAFYTNLLRTAPDELAVRIMVEAACIDDPQTQSALDRFLTTSAEVLREERDEVAEARKGRPWREFAVSFARAIEPPKGAVPTSVNERAMKPKPGRNEACPCGSGKKYKRCCLQ